MAKKNNPRADEFYANRAKKEGYPARSVYKLMEIQKKFKVFGRNAKILDIGAAPGSWSLYVLKELGDTGFLSSVDLLPLEIRYSGGNFFFLMGDAFSPENMEVLIEKGPYSCVLSDAAPSTTGNRTVDTERSLQLAVSVIELADRALQPGGSIVIKVFQGGGEKQLVDLLRKKYESVKAFRPEAVRKISFETYLIGTGKKTSGSGAFDSQ